MIHIRNKFPFVRQLEEIDCGPVCLKMISLYYKKNIGLEWIKDEFNITKLGVTLLDVEKVANKIGFKTVAIKTTINYFVNEKPFPCILHWRHNHFIILFDIIIKKNGVKDFFIADPAYGIVKISENEFKEHWLLGDVKGIALLLQPRKDFQDEFPLNKADSSVAKAWQFLKKYFFTHKKDLILISFLLAASTLLAWLFPILMQQMFDKGISQKNISILWIILFSQIGLIIGQVLSEWHRSFLSVRLSMKLSISIISDFVKKLIHLPISFFDYKTNADIIQRVEDHTRIEAFLSNVIIQNIFQIITYTILSILLITYSFKLFVIFALLSFLSLIWVLFFLKKRKTINYNQFRLTYEYRSYLYEFITGMVEIKLNVAQKRRLLLLERLVFKLYNLNIKSLNLSQLQLLGVRTINLLKNSAISLLCAYWVINKEMTLGVMLSITYIIGFLNNATESFVDFFRSGQDAKLSMDRMDDIYKKQDENNSDKILPAHSIKEGIILDNLSFKYPGSYSSYVLENISLKIPAGKITAIVGASGSGKSTLLKLLLSFYSPLSGNIFIDNENLKNLNSDEWRKKCGVVMQDGYIFSASVAENISLGSDEINEERLKYSCQIACIEPFIHSLPKGYKTKIGESGIGLSGGQRQRILIARAIYNDPSFLFLDEATSSLDSNNEKDILNNLSKFSINKTVIVVAHRLSTVKNADQIVVLEKGKMVEIGTHEELSKNQRYYFNLVKNQLELGS